MIWYVPNKISEAAFNRWRPGIGGVERHHRSKEVLRTGGCPIRAGEGVRDIASPCGIGAGDGIGKSFVPTEPMARLGRHYGGARPQCRLDRPTHVGTLPIGNLRRLHMRRNDRLP